VFLLIGLQINIPALLAAWQPVLWAIAAVLVARLVVVYGLSWLMSHWTEPIALRWQHVLAWGGLRGDEVIIPRGDTLLRAGDVVTTLCERDYLAAVRAVLEAPRSLGA
jgi:hypothetical protein